MSDETTLDLPKEKSVHPELIAKAKAKALELTYKFRKHVDSDVAGKNSFVFSKMQETANAKACALIVCEEKMLDVPVWEYNYYFYDLVRQQIEKL